MRIVAVRKWRPCGVQSLTSDTNVSNSMPGMQQQGLQHSSGMSALRSADGYRVREARFARVGRLLAEKYQCGGSIVGLSGATAMRP